MRIYQLPAVVANQIAAGEVIERPASVVKELLENSFDAGANAISVEIGYGGLNQIKISDNGSGIVADDLPLAIAAHATSKITKLDDLYAINSMGFRGEALASIASIAKLTISSKPAQQELAMMLRVIGNEINVSPCARAEGTTIEVSDLFYNAPVRKRFLKSEKLEFQAIETVFKRFALSAPQINLSLKHNNKLVLNLPAALNEASQLARLSKIFGTSFMKDAIFLDVERGDMRMYGWISSANFQRSQNDKQWVYINHRMVRDKLINHAVKQAYEDLMYPGRFPACLLYFSINNSDVDVNVHPTKHEVRFQQPRLVHDFFTSQIKGALQANAVAIKAPDYDDVQLPNHANDVCEPLPLAFKTTNRLMQTTTANSGLILSEQENAWIVLNTRYVLMFMNKQPYMVDVITLQQQELLSRLRTLDLPLSNRPLLVPIRYALLTISDKHNFQETLRQLGIQSEWQTDEILIRSIPIHAPYLDIRLMLNTLVKMDSISVEQGLEMISQSQIFDPRLLSPEERMQLSLYLFSEEKRMTPAYYKALSLENCRMLLDV